MFNSRFPYTVPALVATALFLSVGTLSAQEERRADTTAAKQDTGAVRDTGEVQNPPGYRGMERDTTLFPADGQDTTAGAVQDRVTGEYDDTTWRDSAQQDTGAVENPPGYRGMERDTTIFPSRDTAAADTAGTEGDTASMKTKKTKTKKTKKADTSDVETSGESAPY